MKDVERPIERHCALVRTVLRSQRVIDVRDRHHLGLQRNLGVGQAPRIARSVELLVVPIGDLRNVAHQGRPRNLAEEVEAVRDVGLHLESLLLVESSFADAQEPELLLVEHGVGGT